MRCVQLWMWSVWCIVCRLHQLTFTPTYWRTPLFSNRQAFKERPRSGNHRRPYQQLFRFKEVQRKTGLCDWWNVIHNWEEKAVLEHAIRLHTRKTIYLKLSLFTYIFYVLSPCTVYIKFSNFILFSFENDDMESSKRCVKLLSLIFIIRYQIMTSQLMASRTRDIESL